ncbi:MAG: PEP/pyruvate-binding domain-containing protein [Candidatus Krumholzibacteria bacterium]|nr:PEP/pyruvate-binding domain-containing protein [Candidatus Krumholzibacteria bacterium]MDH4337355.1 PEP/pyruvate-binding domain-containing protein [Candidatus Krumholzibacteria bacterium]MDH5270116.1 PEP/pyruvate-binding domain-containing protein [Candidatus Krumholzibacteria bacterium]
MTKDRASDIPRFGRAFFTSGESFSRIGDGELGGKAEGLVSIRTELASAGHAAVSVDIPTSAVLATDVFDHFIARNGLAEVACSDAADDRIALAFQKGDLPVEVVGDLRALIEDVHSPLAIRSSSLLEDAMFRPFAGVYQTKMIPNNQSDPDERFHRLVEAIKFVYASVYSKGAKGYIRAAGRTVTDEKMAVIIQEVVGERHFDRYYPHLSGVGRSYNFYPTGGAAPREGVVNLALGLGKTIVDGGISWPYSPAHPAAPPPFASVSDQMKNTQLEFWAVNMGDVREYDPTAETEYLINADLRAAALDDTLRFVASTYDAERGRLVAGIGVDGPRVLNFSPLLEMGEFGLSDAIRSLLALCEQSVGAPVEIEFAATFPDNRNDRARLALLQVRPMVVSDETVTIDDTEFEAPDLLLASPRVMGNGSENTICDVVYVKPERFEARSTRVIAAELEQLNRTLMDDERRYLLIGFGRWGSVDPWLGIPVNWGDIASAKVIVEATLPDMNVEPSQGSHFFHNITSFEVSYFTVHHEKKPGIDWDWLNALPVVTETEHLRHVRCDSPLRVKVDGRSGRGVIRHA